MRAQSCVAAAFTRHMIIQSSSQGAVQSTEVVSHHFSSFVLSRRAVRPHVHGVVTHRAHTHGHVLSCRAARRTLDTTRLSRQTVSNAIAIYLGGALALLLPSIVAQLQCAAGDCSVLHRVCKAVQCRVNHLYRGRSLAASSLLGLSVRFGFREFILGGGRVSLTSPCWPQELGGGGGSTSQGTSVGSGQGGGDLGSALGDHRGARAIP
jgi:hypothetical protein